MALINGKTVKLHVLTEVGTDPFGAKIYNTEIVNVDNVLISPTSDSDAVEELNLYGKRSVYTLHIPKGDNHKWTDTKVEFFGETWRTFGNLVLYQEELCPLSWKGQIKVERFD